MGNGEWGMGNGEWGMGNGEWGMLLLGNTRNSSVRLIIPTTYLLPAI